MRKHGWHKFDKKCDVCKKDYKGMARQRFCSKECASLWENKKSLYPNLAAGTVGSIQELKVSIDLMTKGYEVYRALSPCSSCDLLVLRDGKMDKYEVRTGYKNRDGKYTSPGQNIRADNIALVTPDEICYIKLKNKK